MPERERWSVRGNGGRGHGENIDLGSHLFEALLVGDAEALLLVHDDESELLEGNVLLYESVGPDDDIDLALGEVADDVALLAVGAEPAEDLDADGIGLESLGEGGEVLLGEDGGGHEYGDLEAVGDGLEGSAKGDLGLAVADIAADEPVHGPDAFHIALHVEDGLGLVGGLLVGKGVFELDLPWRVEGEGVALGQLAGGVEGQQFGGHLAGGAFDAGLGTLPLLRAEPGERGRTVERRDVWGHAVEVLHGDVELVALGVVDDEVLAVVALARGASGAGEPAHAMLDVDDVVTGVQLGQERVASSRSSAGCRTTLGGAEYLGVAQDDETAATYAEGQPLAEAGAGVLEDGDRSGTGRLLKGIEERRSPRRCGRRTRRAAWGRSLLRRVGRLPRRRSRTQ